LIDNGVTERGLALADAGYSNTICSNSEKLSLYEIVLLEKTWMNDGEGDFRVEHCMAQVPEFLSHGLDIRKNWPVKLIVYSQHDRILLHNNRGDIIEASRIIVTASVPAIDRHLTFIPPLPVLKKAAIQTVKLENTIKFYLKFSERFWPEKLHGVICADSIVPEIWFDGPQRPGILQHDFPISKEDNGTQQIPYYAVCFICGKYADRVATLGEKQTAKEILEILNNITRDLPEARGRKNPANDLFIGSYMYQWADNPYVLGGYSTCSVNIDVRRTYFEPLQNRIFFAGEAANESFMTIHGALQSSKRVSELVFRSFSPSSRL